MLASRLKVMITIEDMIHLRGWDAYACVAHRQSDPLTAITLLSGSFDHNPATLWHGI